MNELYDEGLDILGTDASSVLPWLSMLSSGFGGNKDDEAKKKAAEEAARKAAAEAARKRQQRIMWGVGLGAGAVVVGLGTWLILRKKR